METQILNDCHSKLNPTRVTGIVTPTTLDELVEAITDARDRGLTIIPFGGRHAMGGQQFRVDTVALDTRGLDRVIALDHDTGIVEIEAGIAWPELVRELNEGQGELGWTIGQKQTGADRMTLGGSLSANIHGRSLLKGPLIEDVVSLDLIDASGALRRCDRTTNADLFRLVIGGYGLFGAIYSLRLQLVPRRKLRRDVTTMRIEAVPDAFTDRIAAGYAFGDFQFSIDHQSDEFLRDGIFSCYRPVEDEAEMSEDASRNLSGDDWMDLLFLAHADKARGFANYRNHYLRTDGNVYWSDRHQFTTYLDNYHEELDRRMKSSCPGSEMITELYVPPSKLGEFMDGARADLLRHSANLIYGTVRISRRDEDSFLAWAKDDWACVIFNLCVRHSEKAIGRAKTTFRALIDRALSVGGSFYLTYHRFARRDQIEAAYPQFADFLRRKRTLDPDLRFQSDWWHHHDRLFSDAR